MLCDVTWRIIFFPSLPSKKCHFCAFTVVLLIFFFAPLFVAIYSIAEHKEIKETRVLPDSFCDWDWIMLSFCHAACLLFHHSHILKCRNENFISMTFIGIKKIKRGSFTYDVQKWWKCSKSILLHRRHKWTTPKINEWKWQ